MVKSFTQVALSQDVTSIALLSSQESQSSLLPLPMTHGIILEFFAKAVGVIDNKVVATPTSEVVVPRMLTVVHPRAFIREQG